MEKEVFVGIDVAKAHLDVACNDEADCTRYTNDEAGISQLVDHLKSRQATLVVLEATGGYLEFPGISGQIVNDYAAS